MIYHTDGYTIEDNPSSIGGGYTIFNEFDDLIITKQIYKKGFTNNEAELLGIFKCLKDYCKFGDEINTDSMCMISWIKKGKSKSRPDLNPLIAECKKLVAEKKIKINWQGREWNLAGIYNETVGLDTAMV